MSRPDFENLRGYHLSEVLANRIWEIVLPWDPFARDVVGKQLVRAADSIGANIAEDTGRGSYQDNKRFVKFAHGSLYKTRHFPRRAFRRRLLNESQIDGRSPILQELPPRLNAHLKSIGPTDGTLADAR